MPEADSVHTALRGIDQPAFAADVDGRLRGLNDAFAELLSLQPGHDRDAAWQACLGDGGLPRWQQGLRGEAPFSDSLRAFRAHGRWLYRASPVLASATGARWLVTLAREALDDSLDGQLIRMSLHAALRAGRMGLWEWNPQTGDSLWSPELYDVYRLPRGSGVEPGSRFLDMLHPDDVAKIDAAVAAAEVKGGIDPFVFRLYAGDGSLRWLMTCAQAAREPGKPFTRLVGVNVDVTDTVQAEDELDAARVERSRQEQIMRAVMEHAPVGIAVALQGEAQLAYVSRFGTRMIQATPEQGRAWSAWRIHHPDSRAPAKTEDLPLFRACQGAVVRNEEWLLQALDGTLVPISCNAGPIHDAEGQVIGGTVAWDDVTPFKEAQRQRDLFLAAVSHELRTPLSAIHGWAEALRRNRDASLLDRALDSIRRNVETQARLVDDLLDAARIAAGKLSLALAPDDLAQIVRAAVDTATPIAAAAQVVLDLTPIDEALPVMADGLRMRQVVCNLLTNAVKFSRPGGRVQVTARRRDGFGDIEVTDDGAGIDAAELGRVFDQFWQSGAGAGRKEGLGLGLSIARYIVQGHGGRVSAHSDGIGRGSTFLVRLPLRT